MVKLGIKLINEKCKPIKVNKHDACYDLISSEDVCIRYNDIEYVKCGIILDIPRNHHVKIYNKSSSEYLLPFIVEGGISIIDTGHYGIIGVTLRNKANDKYDSNYYQCEKLRFRHNGFLIKAGDKIAQFELCKTSEFEIEYVEEPDMSYTRANNKGYTGSGSTGLNISGEMYYG